MQRRSDHRIGAATSRSLETDVGSRSAWRSVPVFTSLPGAGAIRRLAVGHASAFHRGLLAQRSGSPIRCDLGHSRGRSGPGRDVASGCHRCGRSAAGRFDLASLFRSEAEVDGQERAVIFAGVVATALNLAWNGGTTFEPGGDRGSVFCASLGRRQGPAPYRPAAKRDSVRRVADGFDFQKPLARPAPTPARVPRLAAVVWPSSRVMNPGSQAGGHAWRES